MGFCSTDLELICYVSHGHDFCSTHQPIWFSLRTGDDKRKRVKCLSPEQQTAVLELTDPSAVPLEERRRQYNAINRRMKNPDSVKNFPAGLVEKWAAANTPEAKFLVCVKLVVDHVVFIFLSFCHFMFGSSQHDVGFSLHPEVRVFEGLHG